MRPMVRLCVLLALTVGGLWPGMARSQDFAVLAYHDVVDDTGGLTYDGITLRNLAMHFDWLRANGYRVVSVDDLLAARDGRRPLPSRAVLLTFDDGYRSFYTHVYPLLQAFSYPAVFSVVGSFLDAPPQAQVRYGAILVAREDFVSWAELREMQRSGLVEVASHTYALHSTIFTNPQGGEVPAATGQRFIRRLKGPQVREQSLVDLPRPTFGDVRALMALRFQQYLRVAVRLADAAIDYAYDPRTGRYETDQEHRQRIKRDLERNSDLLQAKLGLRPRVISWPFGRWNEAAAAVAREVGMPIGLTLDPERTDLQDLGRIGRFYAAQIPTSSSWPRLWPSLPSPSCSGGCA